MTATITGHAPPRLALPSGWDLGPGSVVLLAAYALKRHYAAATPEELTWILAPTARLVGALTGGTFVAERNVGYVSAPLATFIVPACAGLNYLIIATCTLVFGFLGEFRAPRAKVTWVLKSVVLAYGATVLVNATRIALGLALRRHAIHVPLIPSDQLHRAEGVTVYLTSLWLLFDVTRYMVTRRAP
jgi:exosortase K